VRSAARQGTTWKTVRKYVYAGGKRPPLTREPQESVLDLFKSNVPLVSPQNTGTRRVRGFSPRSIGARLIALSWTARPGSCIASPWSSGIPA